MFCKKCGNQIPDDSEFCPKCGTKVVDSVDTESEISSTLSEVTSKSKKEAEEIATSKNSTTVQENNSKKKTVITIWVLVALLAISAAIFISLYNMEQKEVHKEFEYHLGDRGNYIIDGYLGNETEIVIPNTIRHKPVDTINDKAFYQSNIRKITIGNNITKINKSAFEECKSLTLVTFSSPKKAMPNIIISDNAFSCCEALKTVNIPDGRSLMLGNLSFYKCSSLKSIDMSKIIASGLSAFAKTGFEWVSLNSNHTELGTFSDCINLKRVTLNTNIIPQEMFLRCANLETIVWNIDLDNEIEIGKSAFLNCLSLTEIVMSDGTSVKCQGDLEKYIAENAKTDSKKITIGENAFTGCEKFKPKTKHNEGAGTTYIGKSFSQAIEYADSWEITYWSGMGLRFYDKLGSVDTDYCEYCDDTIGLVIFTDNNRYLSSDLGKTDFIHVGMTLGEVFRILGETDIEYNDMTGDPYISYDLYGYHFILSLSGTSNYSSISYAWIVKS